MGTFKVLLTIKTNTELLFEAFNGNLAANPGALKELQDRKNTVPLQQIFLNESTVKISLLCLNY